MSVSKWRYTEECNGRPCPGDCDHCSFEPSDLISRADAIEAVRKELVCDGRHETHDKTCRFIADVLLSALPSADAVSRESIMAAKFHPYPFTHITPMDVDAEAYKRGWNDALDAVADNAPSAEADMGEYADRLWKIAYERGKREASAEAVQGEWIFNTDENNGKSWNICSVCGYSIFHTTNFCPNCGARMKGGDDE